MNLWQLLTSRCAGDILWELREECGLEQAELLQGAALLRALQICAPEYAAGGMLVPVSLNSPAGPVWRVVDGAGDPISCSSREELLAMEISLTNGCDADLTAALCLVELLCLPAAGTVPFPAPNGVAALLLAGGQSRRMGENKALLLLGGRSLLVHAMEALSPFPEKYLSVDRIGRYEDCGNFLPLPDEFPGTGPLGGLCTAMRHAKAAYLAVCPCDTPCVTRAFLLYLCGLREGYDAVVPVTRDGRPHPLTAVYAVGTREMLAEQLAAGERSVMRFLEKLCVRYVPLAQTPFDDRVLTNVNTRALYERLLDAK
ncbi:molybdenum cofactor guanylyltransferase [Anaerotruncus rubiinfantis]|uniref:molybdenum cofactor guanylyltransferase n=1 Tax=Anaerotruncus rubiinfantis TaxID=1720200 RepID=UPI00082E6D95|nr:molybdenum cofactor guanylyltransferase [Anaerotruncus rubiinfantis]